MYDTLSHNNALMCQILYDYVKRQKSCGPNMKPYDKNPINLFTDQDRIGILYVHNTSSHDDTPLCQI